MMQMIEETAFLDEKSSPLGQKDDAEKLPDTKWQLSLDRSPKTMDVCHCWFPSMVP